MSTGLDIVKAARRRLNIDATGESLSADEANEALSVFNYVIDAWNNQGYSLYNTINSIATLTANKNPHTIGIGGDINIARPIKITHAFTRQLAVTTPVDFQMEQVANDRYQEFIVKNIGTSYPTHFYYDNAYPLASFYVFPVQTQNLELHISSWMQLVKLAALTTAISFPIGYEEALIYAVAVRIAPMYGKTVVRGHPVYDMAAELLRNLKAINSKSDVAMLDVAILSDAHGRGFQIYRGW